MKKENIEYRTMEIESFAENRVVGYAALFDVSSRKLERFTEVIKRNAITPETLQRSDVFACLDHKRSKVLARCRYGKGSLKLSIDERGLRYEFDLPDTEAGKELRAHLERGEITSSSFAFTVLKEDWQRDGETYVRTIERVDQIWDVAPVFEAAYEGTEVALRSLDALQDAEKKAAEAAEAAATAAAEAKAEADRVNALINIRKMRRKVLL